MKAQKGRCSSKGIHSSLYAMPSASLRLQLALASSVY
jgi:hypothetical protein